MPCFTVVLLCPYNAEPLFPYGRKRQALASANSSAGLCRVGARTDRRLCFPLSGCALADPGGDRHAETRHPVEHVASDFCLGPLIAQSPGVKSPADDGLVAKHRCLNQTAAIIARASLPAHASMFCDSGEMRVALRGRRFTCNRCCSWWNNNRRFRVTLGNSVVDSLAIVRPVCRHRRDVIVDLIKEVWQCGDVADIIGRQFRRDDFMRIGIDTEVQLTPPAAGPDAVLLIEPFALAINLQSSAIDQQMQRLCAVNSLRQDRQAATAAAQCGVIGDGDVDFEHVGD